MAVKQNEKEVTHMTQSEMILSALAELLAPKVAELLSDAQPQKDLYSVADLCSRYGVSRETIGRRIRAGEFGETINVGERRRMVTAAGVRAYDEAHLGAPYTRNQSTLPHRRKRHGEPQPI